MRERTFTDPLEALALSDGTLRLLAMVTALETMPDHSLLCIEEPEHGLHPLLFGTLLDLIRPTSGVARVFGIESSVDPVAIHRRIGYLPGEGGRDVGLADHVIE